MFRAHRWPRNVRELRNAVQRLTLTPDRLTHSAALLPQAGLVLPVPGAPVAPLRVARRDASDAFERAYLQGVLTQTRGNVTRVAAVADVSRQMMQKLMRKHGMGEGRS